MTPLLIMSIALGGLPSAPLAHRTTPAASTGDQPPEGPSTVRLSIDHSKLLGPEPARVAERTVRYIREDGTQALDEQHEVTVVDDPEAPQIVVELSWANHGESIYGVVMRTQRPGHDPRMLESFECECIDSGLTAAIVQRLPDALAQLAEDPTAATAPDPGPKVAPPVVVEGPPPGPPGDGPSDRPAKATALGPLGYAGIVVTAGGLGMTGVGIAQLVRGQVTEPSADEQRDWQRDHRPAGRAWLGAGLGTAAVGITMLVVDVTVLKKRRARALTWAPTGGPTQVGLSVSGRF
ncbi:MAG: hypothetical protein AB1Z98_07695 [Nannocystaceae bacterium]